MVNRDYTKEVGIDSGEKVIPWPYVVALFALVAAGAWYGIAEVRAGTKKEPEVKQAATANVPANTLASK
jgi:hypothetical protein